MTSLTTKQHCYTHRTSDQDTAPLIYHIKYFLLGTENGPSSLTAKTIPSQNKTNIVTDLHIWDLLETYYSPLLLQYVSVIIVITMFSLLV